MRRLDDDLLDPEIADTLAVIDATLAGEAVDPAHAEVAELALLLAATRPEPAAEFSRELDQRVGERFRRVEGGRTGSPAAPAARRWLFTPAAAAAGGGLLAAVAVVVALSSGHFGNRTPIHSPATPAPANLKSQSSGAASSSASGAQPEPSTGRTSPAPNTPAPESTLSAPAAPSTGPSSGDAPQGGTPQPPSNGRKVIQSATIDIGAPPGRIENVAQEVLNLVGGVGGIVDRSSVTATGGLDGNARFELRVPSSALQRTMSALSRLKYAHVISRTDNTQDVNTRFVDANRQLADATALRAALLKQLANATSQQQIDSLKARIHDAEAAIAAAQGTLRTLNRQVDFSPISVTIEATAGAGGGSGGDSGGFTIGKAAHDAVRVLAVAAGVALIALAGLVPAALLAALAWWIAATVRRRRREQALDLA
jgi:hypothetical protein